MLAHYIGRSSFQYPRELYKGRHQIVILKKGASAKRNDSIHKSHQQYFSDVLEKLAVKTSHFFADMEVSLDCCNSTRGGCICRRQQMQRNFGKYVHIIWFQLVEAVRAQRPSIFKLVRGGEKKILFYETNFAGQIVNFRLKHVFISYWSNG